MGDLGRERLDILEKCRPRRLGISGILPGAEVAEKAQDIPLGYRLDGAQPNTTGKFLAQA